MKTTKKHNKGQRMRRNAAPAAVARLPRAFARRRPPTAGEQSAAESAALQRGEDSPGWRLVKALGGGLGTTVVGSLLEHQATVPAKWVSLGIAAVGAGLAYGSPNQTLRSVGVGAAAAGTSLLGRVLIDEELFRREEKKEEDKPRVASGSQSPTHSTPPAPGKKPANASDIPADALARAYERARLRMALASDAPN
jgi:hypothetical protein